MSIFENSVIFDGETIPSQEAWVKDYVRHQLKPPGTLKNQDSIARWWANDSAEALEESYKKCSFEGATNHIVALSYAIGSSEVKALYIEKVEDEAKLLKEFFKDTENCRTTIWAGHNIIGFDLRVIKQRAMILGVAPSFGFPLDPKPWDKNVYDTMLKWGNGRDYVKADLLARAFGVQGKGSVDGSMVWPMFQEGKFKEISDYCSDDVRMTVEIYKKMIFLNI